MRPGESLGAYVARVSDSSRRHVERDYLPIVRKLFGLLAATIGLIIALSHFGIEVTAIHNHMLNEHPRLVFLHFWAVDKAETLANSLHAAPGVVHLAPG